MELLDTKRAKSAYEIALSRYDGVRQVEKHEDKTSCKDWKQWSVYDQKLFVDCDDISPDVDVPPTVEVPVPVREVDMNMDRVSELGEVEPLTFPSLPEVDSDEFPVKVHYTGPMFDYGGYAKMNRTFIFGLRDLGVLVKVQPFNSIENVNKPTQDALKMLSNTKLPPGCPKIFGMTVPDLIAHDGRKILFTMMETSEKVHHEYADRLNLADEIWTPSTWCKEVFENSGVAPPIKVMPLGVDTKHYAPGAEPIQFSQNMRGFKFLTASGWSYRKGFDILIRAYLEEFSNKDDVSLIISTRYAGGLSKRSNDKILSEMALIRSMVRKTNGELPHVVLHSTYVSEMDMPRLYNSADCFALISRGEGWGLPYCEAAACGLPVIASDHGGQRDFLDDEVAYMVPPSSYFVSKTTDPGDLKNLSWISHFYEGQKFPDFEGDSFQLVKHHLRYVFENYSEAEKKAAKLRQRMIENFDWRHSVMKAYERLREICPK